MTPEDVLRRIEEDRELARLLVFPGDFDTAKRDPVEELTLPIGVSLHPVAGCGAGGTYFVCGDPGSAWRPVLYAGSEGTATLMADNLLEAVALIAAFPYWQDLGAGHPASEMDEDLADDQEDLDELRQRVVTVLGAVLPTEEEALARLASVAALTAPDYRPTAVEPDGTPYPAPYDLLFHDRY